MSCKSNKDGERRKMRDATLCIPMKQEEILLGKKKKGFGKGRLNGFGGKVKQNEKIEEAAIRELYEEIGLKTDLSSLKKVGEFIFTFPFAKEKDWDQRVHIFLIEDWRDIPKESEEMTFEWINKKKIPFDKMWDDDKYWMPLVLDGKKLRGNFVFDKDNKTVKYKEMFEIK